jgi:hypothetical protein
VSAARPFLVTVLILALLLSFLLLFCANKIEQLSLTFLLAGASIAFRTTRSTCFASTLHKAKHFSLAKRWLLAWGGQASGGAGCWGPTGTCTASLQTQPLFCTSTPATLRALWRLKRSRTKRPRRPILPPRPPERFQRALKPERAGGKGTALRSIGYQCPYLGT